MDAEALGNVLFSHTRKCSSILAENDVDT